MSVVESVDPESMIIVSILNFDNFCLLIEISNSSKYFSSLYVLMMMLIKFFIKIAQL